MATLWAEQIILGKKAFNQVPTLLKEKVKALLEEYGRTDLIAE